MIKMGKIYGGTPLEIKSRKELLTTLRPHYWQFLREDNGDIPEASAESLPQQHKRLSAAV